MKNRLLLPLLLFSANMFSQVWCTPGSVWHFRHFSAFESGYKRLEYLYDTTIAGKTCNKIRELKIGIGGGSVPFSRINYFYTHVDNQVVYLKWYNSNTFDTLYNFNAVIGDKWRMPNTYMPACAVSWQTVQDTGHRMIQGQNLKWYAIAYTRGTFITGWAYSDTIVERLGALEHYPLWPGNICGTSTDATEGGSLRCFSDATINEYRYNYTGPCDYMYVSVEERNAYQEALALYPNPTNGLLQLDLANLNATEPLTIRLTDVAGREIKRFYLSQQQQNHTVDLQALSQGVYFITVTGNRKLLYKGKVVKAE